MSSVPLKLKPSEAATILAANAKNMDNRSKRILQKVVDKNPLSDEEIGELEGLVAAGRLAAKLEDGSLSVTEEEEETIPLSSDLIPSKMVLRERMARRAAIEDRRRIVLELRCQHPPVSQVEIARRLKVNRTTIINDIQRIREKQEKTIDHSTSLRLLGQTVDQYDILHGKAMALVDQYSSPMAKAALLRTAISALDSKTRVMGDTGMIVRVPERQEILVAHADAGTVKERVAKLIQAQEQRTSKTLELPAPREVTAIDLKEDSQLNEDLAEEELNATAPEETPPDGPK